MLDIPRSQVMKERQHLQKALGGQPEDNDALAPGANISTIVRCSNYPHYQAILDQVIAFATLPLTTCYPPSHYLLPFLSLPFLLLPSLFEKCTSPPCPRVSVASLWISLSSKCLSSALVGLLLTSLFSNTST